MLFTPLVESRQFNQLRHQVVRDLAWCCLSPPLLRALPGSNVDILPLLDTDIWPWLQALDLAPDALMDDLARVKSTRLGIYYENLWHFYFTHFPSWQLLARNLPVNRDKATLGAFDFLCRRGDDYWHIETAVKFYLCDTRDQQQAENPEHWIGLNNNDRFDLKLARMRDHQLPLHQTVEGKVILQAHFPAAKNWNSGLCLQGYLFSPAPHEFNITALQNGNLSPSIYHPKNSHEHQGTGFWWHLSDFLAFVAADDLLTHEIAWVILRREQWFSPVQTNSVDLLATKSSLADNIIQKLQITKRPLLIAAVRKNNLDKKSDLWCEQLRGFVVPDNWPNIFN